jgi:hypothetical protein
VDRISVFFTRAALIWLVAGFTLGALMLSDELLRGHWRVWFGPTHGHMLFVGWFLQFAIGIGYWLLPRKRNETRPLGYDERQAFTGLVLLNAGLIVRVVAEPSSRIGYNGRADDWALAASAILQLVAIAILASQIWRRIILRQPRARD